ncbi:MAG: CPBP family intramembrane glutamic endopeptidase [Polyangiales bacterium]|nr:CPBP family intramembrane metalloprotease [Sandaracinaceae bacterium]
MSAAPPSQERPDTDDHAPTLSVPASVGLTALAFVLTHGLFYVAGALYALREGDALPEGLAHGVVMARADALVHGLALAFGLGTATLLATLRGGAGALGVRERVGLVAVGRAALPWAALLGASVHVAGAELVNVLREVWPLTPAADVAQQHLLTPRTWQDGLGAVLAFVALAPLAEEVLFRGVLFPGMTRHYGHAWFAIALSSLLFGVTHVEPVAIFYATLMGAGLAWLTVRARSVVPALVAHAAHNAVPLLLPERVVRIEGLNTLAQAGYHLHPLIVLTATLSALLAARALLHSLTSPP